MANQSIEKSNKRSFWAAILAMQTGIWSVIWLNCTENGWWPHVISDCAHIYIHLFYWLVWHKHAPSKRRKRHTCQSRRRAWGDRRQGWCEQSSLLSHEPGVIWLECSSYADPATLAHHWTVQWTLYHPALRHHSSIDPHSHSQGCNTTADTCNHRKIKKNTQCYMHIYKYMHQHVPYSSKFSWHNIFMNFVIWLMIMKIFLTNISEYYSGRGYVLCAYRSARCAGG